MARIFISGSSTGLGLMAGGHLVKQGHKVVLHGRNKARADDALQAVPGAEAVVIGDLSTIAGARDVAAQANALGRFDAVIHNAAVGYQEPHRMTEDDLPQLFAINSLAPYILTALMEKPKRLVYLSSGMHHGADAHLDDLLWKNRSWRSSQAYAESKLHNVILAFAVARLWPDILANALEPGWVPTRMGGAGAPDDLDQGYLTQAWLAASDEPAARVTGEYFYHMRLRDANRQAKSRETQDLFLDACRDMSGISLPG